MDSKTKQQTVEITAFYTDEKGADYTGKRWSGSLR